METRYRISELAKLAKCQVVTVRYYEKEGLLPEPGRSEGNYRLYEQKHLEQLLFIRRCRSLDMTLEEIRSLLQLREQPADGCRAVNELLEEHIGHVAERIRELQSLESELRSLLCLCGENRKAADCGILKELGKAEAGVERTRARRTHLKGVHRPEGKLPG